MNLPTSILYIGTIISGVSLATEKGSTLNCSQTLLILKNGAVSTWIAQGADALDQNIQAYDIYQGPYSCAPEPVVCTFYLDNTDGKIKQCDEGLFIAQ